MIRRYDYLTSFTVGEFKYHDEVRQKLLEYFDRSENERLVNFDQYYSDNISKLDWNSCQDFDREWVKYFLPKFIDHLSFERIQKNMKEVMVNQIWFQQYNTNGTHGWHVHGCNYTGVYYVEMPNETPVTEMITEAGEIITPEVKEGDILIFPSFISHRAPVNKSKERKTIISFNIDFENPTGILRPNDC